MNFKISGKKNFRAGYVTQFIENWQMIPTLTHDRSLVSLIKKPPSLIAVVVFCCNL